MINMNIYDDYIKYIEEHNYLIKLIENNAPSIYVLFEDNGCAKYSP